MLPDPTLIDYHAPNNRILPTQDEKNEFESVAAIYHVIFCTYLQLLQSNSSVEPYRLAEQATQDIKLDRKITGFYYSYYFIKLKYEPNVSIIRLNHGKPSDEKKQYENLPMEKETGSFKVVKTAWLLRAKSMGKFDAVNGHYIRIAYASMRKDNINSRKKAAYNIQVEREAQALSELDLFLGWVINPHILQLNKKASTFAVLPRSKFIVLMPWLNGTQLFKLLNDNVLSQADKNRVSYKLVCQVNRIHSNKKMILKDLKPDNIIYDRTSGEVRIVDPGLRQQIGQKLTLGGSVNYAPIETYIAEYRRLAAKSDAAKSSDILLRLKKYMPSEHMYTKFCQSLRMEADPLHYLFQPNHEIKALPSFDAYSLGVILHYLGQDQSLCLALMMDDPQHRASLQNVMEYLKSAQRPGRTAPYLPQSSGSAVKQVLRHLPLMATHQKKSDTFSNCQLDSNESSERASSFLKNSMSLSS